MLQQQQQQHQGPADASLFIGCGSTTDDLRGPTLWEIRWRFDADLCAAPLNALRLSAGATVAATTATACRSDCPPSVLRALHGALLLRHLLSCCDISSSVAATALQQVAYAACCSWGRRVLPCSIKLDETAARHFVAVSSLILYPLGCCLVSSLFLSPFGGTLPSTATCRELYICRCCAERLQHRL